MAARTLAEEFLAEEAGTDHRMALSELASASGSAALARSSAQSLTSSMVILNARDIASVLGAPDLKDLLARIDAGELSASSTALPDDAAASSAVATAANRSVSDVIARCNQLTGQIANQIALCYQWLQERYERRFPELASAVLGPLDFAKCVLCIGDAEDLGSVDLTQVLPASALMIVRVTAVSTRGRPLPPPELATVLDGARTIHELEAVRQKLLHFVESRMNILAPNLCKVVGTTIAARLVNAAGGIAELAKMPANYLQALGAKKTALAGFSSAGVRRHESLLFQVDLVESAPSALQNKVVRLITGKAALAARVDAARGDRTGESGARERQECESQVDKWLEPPPVKVVKAIPAPKELTGKTRGGRRARAEKRRRGMTEMRKQANRMNFAEQEGGSYTGMEEGWGLLGSSSGRGRVRVTAEDRGLLKKFKSAHSQVGAATSSSTGGSVTVLRPPGASAVGGATSSVLFGSTGGVELAGRELPSSNVKVGTAASGARSVASDMSGMLSTVSGARPVTKSEAQASRYFGAVKFSSSMPPPLKKARRDE